MNKKFLICIFAIVVILCCVFSACSLFDKPNNPDNPDVGDKTSYKLENLSIGAETFKFVYDGAPKTFAVTLYDHGKAVAEIKPNEAHPDLTLEFANNVEVGWGTVTVKAKSGSNKFSGTVSAVFEIKLNDSRVDAADFAALKQYLSGGLHGNIRLSADVEIPQGEKITVPANVLLDMGEYTLTNRGELTVCGELIVGSTTSAASTLDLINYGKLTTEKGSAVKFNSNGGIINCGQFEHNGKFAKFPNNFRDNYVYSNSALNFSSSQEVKVCVRKSINDSDVTLQNAAITYTGKEIVPSLGGNSSKDVDYTVTCEKNVDVGKYGATFTATPHSKYYYGQRTFEYEITPAPYETPYKEAFVTALKNANYSPVTFSPKNKTYMEIAVLPNVTVNVSNCSISPLTLAENSVLNVYGDECSIGASGSVTLKNNAEINVLGSAVIYKDVGGSGKINVLQGGELFFYNTVKRVDAAIGNEGAVYSDFALSNVTGGGTATVRRQLEESEITAEKLDYTGQDLQVVANFAHSDDKNYSVAYRSGSDYSASAYPKERGEYQARLRFGEKNKYYCGTVEFGFTVSKGKITVTNSTTLANAITNGNYDRYEIAEWRVIEPFEIPSGNTVIAENVVNNSELTVDGTLSVAVFTNNSGKTLTVADGGLLKLRGNFYNVDGTSVLNLESEESFVNVGVGAVYLCDADNAAVTGQKYIRTANLSAAVFLDVSEARYGVNTKPTFVLQYASAEVSAGEYGVSYLNSSYRTAENGATIRVTAALGSQTFYGQAECSYTVLGGRTTVKTGDELLAALNDLAYGTELCNFEEIATAEKLYLHENNKQGQVDKYHVYSGTTLVVKHRVEYWDIAPDKSKFSFQNNGVIEFRDGGTIEDAYLWQENGTDGVFELYVSAKEHLTYHGGGGTYDYIRLETDLNVESGKTLYIQSAANGVTLDLNGHEINGIEDKSTFEIITGGKTVTVQNGTIVPKIKVTSSPSAVGRVVLNNVTHGEIEDVNGAVR